jgi:hypothetical protein
MPFGLDGAIRMRYAYVVVADNEIRFEACAQFPAFGPATIHCGDGTGVGNYYYTETMKAVGTSVTSNVVEIPTF